MTIRFFALLTIVAGMAVLTPSPAAAGDEDLTGPGETDGPNPPVRRYFCAGDTDGDGTIDITCWGYNGCEVSSTGCHAW